MALPSDMGSESENEIQNCPTMVLVLRWLAVALLCCLLYLGEMPSTDRQLHFT